MSVVVLEANGVVTELVAAPSGRPSPSIELSRKTEPARRTESPNGMGA